MATRNIEAGRAFLRLVINDEEFIKGFDRSLAKAQSFGKSVAKVGASIAAAGAAITAPFIASLKILSNLGGQLDDMSKRTGVSVEALSELKFAAEQSGASLENVEIAIRSMARNLLNAEAGTGAAAEAIERLGLELNSIVGQSPEKQFERITEALSQVKDPTLRAGLAMRIFGRSGTAIIPMIEDIDELRRRARELGIVMSTETAAAGDRLGDAFDALKLQGQAVAVSMASAIAPAVTRLVEGISQVLPHVIEWISQNKELVAAVAALGVGLVAIGTILGTAGVAIVGLTAVIGAVATPAGAAAVAIIAIGTAATAAALAIPDLRKALVELGGEIAEQIKLFITYRKLIDSIAKFRRFQQEGIIPKSIIPSGPLRLPDDVAKASARSGADRLLFSQRQPSALTGQGLFGFNAALSATNQQNQLLRLMSSAVGLGVQNAFAFGGVGGGGSVSADFFKLFEKSVGQIVSPRSTFSGKLAGQILGGQDPETRDRKEQIKLAKEQRDLQRIIARKTFLLRTGNS